MQWQVIADQALQFRCWEEEYVVYNACSGDTHVLAAQAAELLMLLQRASLDTEAAARLLAEKWQCELTSDFLEELEMTLCDMHALSLVKRVLP
jgi:PqqD family protein of HPr-rel-A system